MRSIVNILLIGAVTLLIGCVTKNPMYKPNEPVSADNPVYSADTNKIHNARGTLEMINGATAPADPYAPLISAAIPAGEALVTAGSLLLASIFNNKAKRKDKALRAVVRADTTEQAVKNAPDVASEIMAHHET